MVRRAVLVVVLVLSGTLAPVEVAGAFGAGLPQVPRATACTGGASLSRPVPSAGSTISLEAQMACGTHWVIFAGNAVPSTLADLCSGSPITLQFVGTESVDYAPPSATQAMWTLQGRNGTYLVTTQNGAGGAARVGAIVGTGCDQFGAGGPLALAQATTTGSLPDVFSCHAALTATPQNIFSGRGGSEIEGPAAGAGTCQSTNGVWDVQLNGKWSVGGTPCAGSTYDFRDTPLQLTGSAGSLSVPQLWSENAQDHHLLSTQGNLTPSGGGQIAETPDPCVWASPTNPLPPPFQVTADWVFFVE
jgi:hypothetical protein